jgi:hypothetical protein
VGLPEPFTLLLDALLGRPITGLFFIEAVEVEEDACGIAIGTERLSTTPLVTFRSSSISGTSFRPEYFKSWN